MTPNSLTLTSTSPQRTGDLGKAFAAVIRVGDLIGLEGDLGAGKTVLTQGIAEGLGAPEPATSPSFVIAHTYRGRIKLVHVDLYRLSSMQASELGLEDYLADSAGVVEWAERLTGLEPDLWIKFDFASENANQRTLIFKALSPRGEILLAAIAKALR
jgi:tRNA threonylcarbamoyladenosine biosynthesis protein TsaE